VCFSIQPTVGLDAITIDHSGHLSLEAIACQKNS